MLAAIVCDKCGSNLHFLREEINLGAFILHIERCETCIKKSKQKTQWIKCSERMPACGEICIIYDSYKCTTNMAIYIQGIGEKKLFYSVACGDIPISTISHWQPLPLPPED
jgi:hypothetical protein